MRIREKLVSAAQVSMGSGEELGAMAVFFDTENIILGIKDDFHVKHVINFLQERGDVLISKAYADWGRYRRLQRMFLEEGVQMVFLPSYGVSDKNRTDTAICVDAMEVLFTREPIDTFVIVSGDSDFGVLAQRLRMYGKTIVGVSAKSAASHVLVKQCHEFVFYETLVGQRVQGFSQEDGAERIKRALANLIEEYGGEFRASLLKDRMRKQDPTFSERNYGASSFTKFLETYSGLVEVKRGGMLQVVDHEMGDLERGPERERERERSRPALPPKLLPEIADEAREVLARALVACEADREPVRLSRFKDALQSVAPDFDELGIGFRTFTAFLKAFPDVVELDRSRNQVRPASPHAEPDRGADDEAAPAADVPKAKRPAAAPEPAPRAKAAAPRPQEAAPSDLDEAPERDDDAGAEPKRSLSREERRRVRAAARPTGRGSATDEAAPASDAPTPEPPAAEDDGAAPKKRSSRRGGRGKSAKAAEASADAAVAKPEPAAAAKDEAPKQATSRRGGAKKGADEAADAAAKKGADKAADAAAKKPAAPKATAADKAVAPTKKTSRSAPAKKAAEAAPAKASSEAAAGKQPARRRATRKKSDE